MTSAQYDLKIKAKGTVTIKGTNELPNLTQKSGLNSKSRRNLAITILEKEVHRTANAATAKPLAASGLPTAFASCLRNTKIRR